jgi:hypothetical protein
MPEKTYHIVFETRPASRIKDSNNIEFVFNKSRKQQDKVLISELNKKVDGVNFPIGLEIRADVKSDSAEIALGTASTLANGVAGFITLATSVAIPIPKPMSVIESTEGVEKRDFVQYFYNLPTSDTTRGEIIPQEVTKLIDTFDKITDPDISLRVAGAIRLVQICDSGL